MKKNTTVFEQRWLDQFDEWENRIKDNYAYARRNFYSYIRWDEHKRKLTEIHNQFPAINASHNINYKDWLTNRVGFRSNIHFVLAAVEQDWTLLKYASDKLKRNWKVVLTAMKQNPLALVFASSDLKSSINFKSEVLSMHRNLFNDRNFMLKLLLLELSSMKIIISKYAEVYEEIGTAKKLLNKTLRNDKQFILDLVQRNTRGWYIASEHLQQDKEIFFATVKRYGLFLSKASDEIKKDKKIVLAAVKSAGMALKLASNDIKNDQSVVLAASIQSAGYALKFASKQIQINKKLITQLINKLEPSCLNSMILFFTRADKNDINDVLLAIRDRMKDKRYRKKFKLTYRKTLPNEIKDKLSFDLLSTPEEMSDYMHVLFDTKRYNKLEPISKGRYETSIFSKIMFFLPRQDIEAVKTSFTSKKQADCVQCQIWLDSRLGLNGHTALMDLGYMVC